MIPASTVSRGRNRSSDRPRTRRLGSVAASSRRSGPRVRSAGSSASSIPRASTRPMGSLAPLPGRGLRRLPGLHGSHLEYSMGKDRHLGAFDWWRAASIAVEDDGEWKPLMGTIEELGLKRQVVRAGCCVPTDGRGGRETSLRHLWWQRPASRPYADFC